MYNICIIPFKIVNFFVQKALLATTLNAYLYYHHNKKLRSEKLNLTCYNMVKVFTNYSRECHLQTFFPARVIWDL